MKQPKKGGEGKATHFHPQNKYFNCSLLLLTMSSKFPCMEHLMWKHKYRMFHCDAQNHTHLQLCLWLLKCQFSTARQHRGCWSKAWQAWHVQLQSPEYDWIIAALGFCQWSIRETSKDCFCATCLIEWGLKIATSLRTQQTPTTWLRPGGCGGTQPFYLVDGFSAKPIIKQVL